MPNATKKTPQAQISLLGDIFVDCFAGGGGWSTGAELALGRIIDIAINHDPDAVAMHKANHPYTEHYCENIFEVNPITAVRARNVVWAHFSPDCKHFSKAKGSKPVNKKIRGLAWVVLRWAALVKPEIISLENVEEFKTWGPVRRGKPIKAKSGQTFLKWKSQLEAIGYVVEHRELLACDYGAPTSRKRFFLIARRDGKPIVWPGPSHGSLDSEAVKSGRLLPWRPAAEIIDWEQPAPSIFATKEEIKVAFGLKAQRPLAVNTMRRVIRGVDKFVIQTEKPYILKAEKISSFISPSIVTVNHSGEFRGQDTRRPLQTITSKHGYAVSESVLTPVLTAIGQTGSGSSRCRSVEEPVHTTVSKAESCIIAPTLIQYHTECAEKVRGQSVKAPIMTVDAANRYGLIAPILLKMFGASKEQEITTPLPTTLCSSHDALVLPYISKYFSGGYDGVGIDVKDPLPTVTAVDHNAMVFSHVTKMKGSNLSHPVFDSMQTTTSGGPHFSGAKTTVIKAQPGIDLGNWPKVRELLNQYCDYALADNEVLLLAIEGAWYFISDIGLRMLLPRELYLANGFPVDYIIDRDAEGKVYGKVKQVARCGNAVPPPFAYALVRANAPEYCGQRISTMAELEQLVAV